ncbi:MAG: hypothetical protein NT062_34310 [Proteobacteria bacterium]|nr:hypothetical protein [Pseudomonadota bacterium]
MSDDERAPDDRDEDEIPDDVLATLSDFLDGVLPIDERPRVEAKLRDDALWKRAHNELLSTRGALSTLRRARAPQTFDQDVTSTIHKRSAGRFFARRTFGDRVPFGLIMVVAVIALIAIGITLYSSQTGSLKSDKQLAPRHHEPVVDPL